MGYEAMSIGKELHFGVAWCLHLQDSRNVRNALSRTWRREQAPSKCR